MQLALAAWWASGCADRDVFVHGEGPTNRGAAAAEPSPDLDADALSGPAFDITEGAIRGTDAYLYQDVVHELHLVLDDDALDALDKEPRVDVPGLLTADDDPPTYPIAIRLKGTSSFRTLDVKPAFKIDFHQWDPGGRFHGIKRLNLNNMVQDPTMLHEFTYYGLCQELGIPAPRHTYARVWLNDEDMGLYGVVEAMDEQLVDRLWPDDDAGVMYEGQGNDFVANNSDLTLEEGTDEGQLLALVDTVEATAPEDWAAMVEANFDDEALFAYLALDVVTGNPDGYATHHNNYYAYLAPLARRWTLLPSGVDRAFTDTRSVSAYLSDSKQGRLVAGCMANDACRERLYAQIEATLDAWEALDVVARVTEKEAIVGPLCQADPRRDRDCRSGEILGYLQTRVDFVREGLE